MRSATLVQSQPTASQLHAGAKSSAAPVSRDSKDWGGDGEAWEIEMA